MENQRLAARPAARPPEAGTEVRGGRGRQRERAGIVAAVQLRPAEGPGIRDDQGEAVRTERGERPRAAAAQRLRKGEMRSRVGSTVREGAWRGLVRPILK